LSYSGDFSSESLIDFINANKVRAYGRLTQEDRAVVQAFFETKRAFKAIICVSDGNTEQLSVAAATPAALKAIGLNNMFVGIVGSEFAPALSHFGVEENDLPVVVVHGNANAEDKRKFKSSLSSFTADAIAKFVKEASEGNAPRWVKSEPTPPDNSAPVKIVTGNTVQDIVLDESKDVLLEVYVTPILHCIFVTCCSWFLCIFVT
jgi:protein disulfide-isomerase A1